MAGTCPDGHPVDAGSKFCSECGAPVPVEPTPVEPAPASSVEVASSPPERAVDTEPGALGQAPHRRHRRLLIGAIVGLGALVAIIVVVALVVGGGRGSTTTQIAVMRTVPKPKPAPTRYVQLLSAGMSKQRAVTPLCASYRTTIGRWQQAAQTRTAAMSGVSSSDPYAAADFVGKPGMGWLRAQTQASFTAAIVAASRKRLVALAGSKRRYLTDTMVSRFNDDALYLCHQTATWQQTETALSQLDTKSSTLVEAAANKPWYPKGYYLYDVDPTIAYQWDNNVSKCQSNYSIDGEVCWGMRVVTQNGCPSSVYAAISILQGQTAIDYSNDTLAGLSPGQFGELAFTAFENGSGPFQGHLTEIKCY